MVLSALSFALMNLFVQLAGDLPTSQKAFFRNFIALIIATVTLIANKKSFIPQKKYLPSLLMRAVCGTLGILCNFFALGRLHLSDASILNKMSPFFAVVFSILILKEKIEPYRLLLVLGAFVGAVFVIKPSFSNPDILASLAGFAGGMGAGCAYTFVRKLGTAGCEKSYIVFFFSLFSTLVLTPFLIVNFKPMSLYQLIILILCGVAAAGGQYFITFAYSFAPASRISVYDYSQLIFTTILGFFIFGQVPDIYSFIGYFIIILMAVIMFIHNNKPAKAHQSREDKGSISGKHRLNGSGV